MSIAASSDAPDSASPAAPRGRRALLRQRGPRAVQGLLAVFVLSLLNLLGAFIMLTALGGIAPWTGWQFVGVFGFVEMATGIAMLVAPNAWQLPVRAAADGVPVTLSLRRMLLPRWGASAKVAAGLTLLAVASTRTGVAAGAALVPLVALAVALVVLALSLAVARWGVAHPGLDVLQVVLRRPGRADIVLPGVSLSSLLVQFLLNITVIPLVKIAPPTLFYRPSLGPSLALAAVAAAAAALAVALAIVAWRGRFALREAHPSADLEATNLS